MMNNAFHTAFKLNGVSFTSVEELLLFSNSLSNDVSLFLQEWFSTSLFVNVTTSGSTGKPTNIQLKKEYMLNSALATGGYFKLFEGTRALLCMSSKYIAGKMMLVRGLSLGWSLDVVPPTSNPLAGLGKKYDFCAMVPMQLQNSLNEIEQIKKLIVGGGKVSLKLQAQIQQVSTEVFATFGMTETITHIAVQKLNHAKIELVKERYSYVALPDVSISIDDRNCLMIDAPKVSDQVIFTNDVVELVSENRFIWLGRFDNVINSGGVKLHPEEIEKKLSSIISNRFFVAGQQDHMLGERLILIIEIATSTEETAFLLKESIFQKLRDIPNLTKYEIPKEIHFVANFIETETKKIQRNKSLKLALKSN